MSDKTNWYFTERLTNEEFHLVLPHLTLENIFLTQIYVPKKKWLRLIDANFQKTTLLCGVCSKQMKFIDVYRHLQTKEHNALIESNVVQFYHPFYTFGKADVELAKGEIIPISERKLALKEMNTHIRNFIRDFVKGDRFAKLIQHKAGKPTKEDLINMALDANIINVEEMILTAYLPFNDMSQLLFCNNDWHPMIVFKQLIKKGAFTCSVCSVNCKGLESLNSHLNGNMHKCNQLRLRDLQYKKNVKINKNCCIQFGDDFKIEIQRESARNLEKKLEMQYSDKKSHEDNFITVSKIPENILIKINNLDQLIQKLIKPEKYTSAIDMQGIEKNIQYLGHVGVEYVLKILKQEEDEAIHSMYECCLCKVMGNDEKMQKHILSFDHIKKYLDFHYSDTIKKYEHAIGHMKYADYHRLMKEIVFKIAAEIEKHHGRSLPYTVSSREYKEKRLNLIALVHKLPHATQNKGPSFSNSVSNDEIKELKQKINQNVDNVSSSRLDKFIEKSGVIFTTLLRSKRYLKQTTNNSSGRSKENSTKQSSSSKIRENSLSNIDDENNIRYDRRYSPSYRDNTNNSPSLFSIKKIDGDNSNIFDIYHREISNATKDIEFHYNNYRKNPEDHPLYEEEWNEFWQTRKLELENEGLNYRTYNFQPEWVHYFKQRIDQLFEQELRMSQINIRRKLGIYTNSEEDFTKQASFLPNYNGDYNGEKSTVIRTESQLDISGKTSTDAFLLPPHKRRCIEYPNDIKEQEESTFSVIACNNMWRSNIPPGSVQPVPDNHSNLVHVLRLFTALEDDLGSLGCKVMDLLAKALQLEKCCDGNIVEFESKILTSSNCNMLETALEKLKGILFAGILDDKKITGVNRVIQVGTELLNYAEKRGWRNEVHSREQQQGTTTVQLMQNASHNIGSRPITDKEKSLPDALLDFVSKKYIDNLDTREDAIICPSPPLIKMSKEHISYGGNKELINQKNTVCQNLKQHLTSRLHQNKSNFSDQIEVNNFYDSNKSITSVTTISNSGVNRNYFNNNYSNATRYQTSTHTSTSASNKVRESTRQSRVLANNVKQNSHMFHNKTLYHEDVDDKRNNRKQWTSSRRKRN